MPAEVPKLADNNNWQRKGVQTRVKGERVGPTSKHLPHSQAPLHLSCIARNVYPISFTKSKGICTFDPGNESFWSSEWLYLHFPEDASPGFWSLHSFFFDQVFKNTLIFPGSVVLQLCLGTAPISVTGKLAANPSLGDLLRPTESESAGQGLGMCFWRVSRWPWSTLNSENCFFS